MESDPAVVSASDGQGSEDAQPAEIYVNELNLVLVGERVFLVDESNFSDIREEVAKYAADPRDVVTRPLHRDEAYAFARYLDWDDACSRFPVDHPIQDLPIPALRTMELGRDDPRLSEFDLDGIRAAADSRAAKG